MSGIPRNRKYSFATAREAQLSPFTTTAVFSGAPPANKSVLMRNAIARKNKTQIRIIPVSSTFAAIKISRVGQSGGCFSLQGNTVRPTATAAARWRLSLETNSVSLADNAAARCSASNVRIEIGCGRCRHV